MLWGPNPQALYFIGNAVEDTAQCGLNSEVARAPDPNTLLSVEDRAAVLLVDSGTLRNRCRMRSDL